MSRKGEGEKRRKDFSIIVERVGIGCVNGVVNRGWEWGWMNRDGGGWMVGELGFGKWGFISESWDIDLGSIWSQSRSIWRV